MGLAGRQAYLQKYTPEMNYQRLMNIYEMARENAQHSRGCESAAVR
jgi:hypothetical protein